MIKFPDKRYQIIYADPPWAFNFQKRNGLSDSAKARLYQTMDREAILALPVKDIAAPNCALFLWVMSSELPLALDCISAWGFVYKTVAFTWVKTTVSGKYCFGGGNWTRSNPELCLLATKGKPKRVSASVRELVVAQRREHSRKPDEIRNSIVDLCGDLSRIELFAREMVDGWDTWGNEIVF
jgi:site-specific DNA-methyltransferase (adenine-specific)